VDLFDVLRTSASGLAAQRFRLEIIANNMANLNTTRTALGGPFKRQFPVFSETIGPQDPVGQGVAVMGIVKDSRPGRLVYDPQHPDADGRGYVELPNVEPMLEMVDMIAATRAYEANITVMNAAKNMFQKALEIGRGQ